MINRVLILVISTLLLMACRAQQTPLLFPNKVDGNPTSTELIFTLSAVSYPFQLERSPFSIPNGQFEQPEQPFAACQPKPENAAKPPTAAYNRYPLAELTFQGVMRNSTRRVALFSLPSGEVVAVKAGQRIGAEYAQLTGIEAEQIALKLNCDSPVVTWSLSNQQ